MGFDVNKTKTKSGTKSKIPKKRMEQIKQYVDEIDENTKQFARELNELPANEDNRDNIMLQDIIIKNEIVTDNSIKLIETSLTEIGIEASTQTGGLSLRELEGLDRELRMISGFLRSAIAKSIAKQVDIAFFIGLDVRFSFHYSFPFLLDIWFIFFTIEIDLYICSNVEARRCYQYLVIVPYNLSNS